MQEFIFHYGLFLAKTVTLVVALGAIVILIAVSLRESRRGGGERLEIKHVNQQLEHAADVLNAELLNDAEYKLYAKARKQQEKSRQKAPGNESTPRLFVLDFIGDLEASAVESLREEISALLQVTRSGDEVLLRLESAGGVVQGYGLAASQLRRLRDRGLRLTIAIDKVAASGGYLMASVADHIVAAPFAIVGSIGVVGQLPNFSRLLRDNKIDYEMHTAGEYKRTLTIFGENTDEGRAKFREELEQVHQLFKGFVAANRPKLELTPVTTGEYWYGSQALALGLVDELKTSDDLLLQAAAKSAVYTVRHRPPRNLRKWLLGGLGGSLGAATGLHHKLLQLP